MSNENNDDLFALEETVVSYAKKTKKKEPKTAKAKVTTIKEEVPNNDNIATEEGVSLEENKVAAPVKRGRKKVAKVAEENNIEEKLPATPTKKTTRTKTTKAKAPVVEENSEITEKSPTQQTSDSWDMGKDSASNQAPVAEATVNSQVNKVNSQVDDVRDILNSVNPNVQMNNPQQTGYSQIPNNRPMHQKTPNAPMRNPNVRIINNGGPNHAMAANPNMNRQMPNRNMNANFAAQNNQQMGNFQRPFNNNGQVRFPQQTMGMNPNMMMQQVPQNDPMFMAQATPNEMMQPMETANYEQPKYRPSNRHELSNVPNANSSREQGYARQVPRITRDNRQDLRDIREMREMEDMADFNEMNEINELNELNKYNNQSKVQEVNEQVNTPIPAQSQEQPQSPQEPVVDTTPTDPNAPVVDANELYKKDMTELYQMAAELGIEGIGSLEKSSVIFEILRSSSEKRKARLVGGGFLEIMSDSFGYLRSPLNNYQQSNGDIYVSQNQIKRFSLKTGDYVFGELRIPRDKERFFNLFRVESINNDNPEKRRNIIPFNALEPDFPTERLILERDPNEYSTRVFDLVTPIGKGQRGLIVAPPRTGKTVLLQQVALSIRKKNPDVHLIILLIDERPEEVTDMKRQVDCEVVSSTFDEPPERHIRVAEMVIEKAKRLVENKKDVVILLDSITRLARAYNTYQPHSGKILTGGVDATALHKPKRFFGAARNIKNHGSLTIIATALIDTGSRMDDVIFEEFKGTGNMELHLDRSIADRRIYPAINVEKSGTRKEELLLHPDELQKVWLLRKAIIGTVPSEAMEMIVNRLKKVPSNTEFLLTLQK